MVNYIKSKFLKPRLIYQICEKKGARFKTLRLHTQVHWLSRGRILCPVFELKDIVLKIFEENHQNKFCNLLQYEVWCNKLAYVSDAFEHLNRFNLSIHRRAENILTSIEKICTVRQNQNLET